MSLHTSNDELYKLYHRLTKDSRWRELVSRMSSVEMEYARNVNTAIKADLVAQKAKWEECCTTLIKCYSLQDEYVSVITNIHDLMGVAVIGSAVHSLSGMKVGRRGIKLDTCNISVQDYQRYTRECYSFFAERVTSLEKTSKKLASLLKRKSDLEATIPSLEYKILEYTGDLSSSEVLYFGLPEPEEGKISNELQEKYTLERDASFEALIALFPINELLIEYKTLYESVNASLTTCERCGFPNFVTPNAEIYEHACYESLYTKWRNDSLTFDNVAEFVKIIATYSHHLNAPNGRYASREYFGEYVQTLQ